MKKILILLIVLVIIGGVLFFHPWQNLVKKENSSLKEETIRDKDIQNSIFKKYYKNALAVVQKMTLEEKVGQLFLVRYDASQIENLKGAGGYILFARDFENHTRESFKKELERVKKENTYPLIIGVDEEGGYVTRVSRFPAYRKEKFSSPKYYYERGGYELLKETETEKATLLKSLGINLNLAPVADVSIDENDFIYSRSFGRDAKETADFIQKMVQYANENEINSCLKHFPGYGNNKDTHTGIAIDERSYTQFIENDFLPFQAGIDSGVPSILISHNIVKALDENYPASLSKKVIDELRNTLHFTGIIMTDDLAMDAVKSYVENKDAATLAINAGNDMIITSSYKEMYEEVLNSVKENKIKEETINKAVLRIIAWKYASNLFE